MQMTYCPIAEIIVIKMWRCIIIIIIIIIIIMIMTIIKLIMILA